MPFTNRPHKHHPTTPPQPPRIVDADSLPHYHRSVFISDFHMGYKGFDARAALEFLQTHDCDILYLVGDIIDGWKLRKRWFWTAECSAIFDELAQKRKNGTKIIYIPGNHDDAVRRISPLRRYRFATTLGIGITNIAIHKTADDRKFIVMHGDQFDNILVRGKLSEWGDRLYLFFTEWTGFSPLPKRIHVEGKTVKFSLAKALMRQSKRTALALMNNLEKTIFRMIRARHVDGLICGHTHIAGATTQGDKTYINTGSWTGQTNTALVESHAGELSILCYPSRRNDATGTPIPHTIQFPHKMQHHAPETRFIVNKIAALWPQKYSTERAATAAQPRSLNLPLINTILKDLDAQQRVKACREPKAQPAISAAAPHREPPRASAIYNSNAA